MSSRGGGVAAGRARGQQDKPADGLAPYRERRSWNELRPPLPYDAYKTVINALRKYPAHEIVSMCATELHMGEKADLRHQPPWLLLLLMKWAIREAAASPASRRHLTRQDFGRLVNKMHNFDGAASTAALSKDNYLLFLRRMAFQQFFLQQQFGLAGLSRQYEFFGRLPPEHGLVMRFRELTGIEPGDFCELALGLTVKCVKEDAAVVDPTWFRTVEPGYSAGVVQGFLGAISQDSLATKQRLMQLADKRRDLALELCERSPLWDYPLLAVDSKFVCYSPVLLYDRLQYYIYHALRGLDADWFMKRFGDIFCRYVGKGVGLLRLPALSEVDLQKAVGRESKVVDFLLQDDQANILIEAKGVQLPDLGKLSLDATLVRERLGPSIRKAVLQAYSVLRALSNLSSCDAPLQARSENYLLIVTYEQMYLANGRSAQNALDLVADMVDSIDEQTMPLEHIYIMSIDDFDMLAHAISESNRSLVTVLREAVGDDRDPSTSKLVFSQHIMKQFGSTDLPSYLARATDELTESLKSRFGRPPANARRGC